MRVHELARELGLSSKTVMDVLAGMKVHVKSHSSTLDEGTVERVRRQAKAKAAPQPAAPPPGPVRVAKTPTGERILGMRKIVLPPPPPPPVETPVEPAAASAPSASRSSTSANRAASRSAGNARSPHCPDRTFV